VIKLTDKVEKDLKEFMEFTLKSEFGEEANPGVSEKCEIVLKQPVTKDLCYDFRKIRQRVLCRAWELIEKEKIPFRDAIRKSWREIKEECARISAVI